MTTERGPPAKLSTYGSPFTPAGRLNHYFKEGTNDVGDEQRASAGAARRERPEQAGSRLCGRHLRVHGLEARAREAGLFLDGTQGGRRPGRQAIARPRARAVERRPGAWLSLLGAPAHENEEEHMERQPVEYTFAGEKLSFVPGEYGDLTLYRTDED